MNKGFSGFSFNRCKKPRAMRAVTLVELVIVILLTGILSTAVATLLQHSLIATGSQYSISQQGDQAELTLERMTRDMRKLKAGGLSVMTPTTVTFTDIDNKVISYALVGTLIERNNQPLLDNVRTSLDGDLSAGMGLQFAYYDGAGNVTISSAAVRYISISLTTMDEYTTMKLSTIVFLRNAG